MAKRKLTEEEIAFALSPTVPESERIPIGKEARQVKVPTLWPESPQAVGERLRGQGLVREEGKGEFPPQVVQKSRRLTITQVDGKVDTIELDPYESNPYLVVERQEPVAGTPWVREAVAGRYGVFSIASITLEDVEP